MDLICDVPELSSDAVIKQEHRSETVRVCLISLGEEVLFVDLNHVREVFKVDSITPVPSMPALLVGVANLRGTIVPLVDLTSTVSLFTSAAQKYAVVIQHSKQHVGILIDRVPEIRIIATEDRVASPTQVVAEHHSFLSGFFKNDHHVGGMLEVSQLLAFVEGAMGKQQDRTQEPS